MSAPLWRLRKGAPLCIRTSPRGMPAPLPDTTTATGTPASLSRAASVGREGTLARSGSERWPSSPAAAADNAAIGGPGSDAAWTEALLVGKPAGVSGQVDVLLASGEKVRIASRDARARSGEGHPVACAVGESLSLIHI